MSRDYSYICFFFKTSILDFQLAFSSQKDEDIVQAFPTFKDMNINRTSKRVSSQTNATMQQFERFDSIHRIINLYHARADPNGSELLQKIRTTPWKQILYELHVNLAKTVETSAGDIRQLQAKQKKQLFASPDAIRMGETERLHAFPSTATLGEPAIVSQHISSETLSNYSLLSEITRLADINNLDIIQKEWDAFLACIHANIPHVYVDNGRVFQAVPITLNENDFFLFTLSSHRALTQHIDVVNRTRLNYPSLGLFVECIETDHADVQGLSIAGTYCDTSTSSTRIYMFNHMFNNQYMETMFHMWRDRKIEFDKKRQRVFQNTHDNVLTDVLHELDCDTMLQICFFLIVHIDKALEHVEQTIVDVQQNPLSGSYVWHRINHLALDYEAYIDFFFLTLEGMLHDMSTLNATSQSNPDRTIMAQWENFCTKMAPEPELVPAEPASAPVPASSSAGTNARRTIDRTLIPDGMHVTDLTRGGNSLPFIPEETLEQSSENHNNNNNGDEDDSSALMHEWEFAHPVYTDKHLCLNEPTWEDLFYKCCTESTYPQPYPYIKQLRYLLALFENKGGKDDDMYAYTILSANRIQKRWIREENECRVNIEVCIEQMVHNVLHIYRINTFDTWYRCQKTLMSRVNILEKHLQRTTLMSSSTSSSSSSSTSTSSSSDITHDILHQLRELITLDGQLQRLFHAELHQTNSHKDKDLKKLHAEFEQLAIQKIEWQQRRFILHLRQTLAISQMHEPPHDDAQTGDTNASADQISQQSFEWLRPRLNEHIKKWQHDEQQLYASLWHSKTCVAMRMLFENQRTMLQKYTTCRQTLHHFIQTKQIAPVIDINVYTEKLNRLTFQQMTNNEQHMFMSWLTDATTAWSVEARQQFLNHFATFHDDWMSANQIFAHTLHLAWPKIVLNMQRTHALTIKNCQTQAPNDTWKERTTFMMECQWLKQWVTFFKV